MDKKKKYRLIYLSMILLAILLVGVLAFAVYKLNTEYIPQKKEAERFSQLKELAYAEDTDESAPANGETHTPAETTPSGTPIPRYSLDQLFGMNGDMVAWLTVPDTKIDYPVMHTPDDVEYYLHTDFDGYYSFSGCPFVGDGCDIDSDIFVIYGHNMNNGTMFGEIDLYSDSDYMAQHSEVFLRTKDETRVYRVFAAFPTKVYDRSDTGDEFRYYDSVGEKTEDEYNDIVNKISALSAVPVTETPNYPAQIVYLSTCAYHEDNGRFVVAAYRIQ